MKPGGLIVLGALLALPVIASAQDVVIGPLKNANPKDVSSLSADCETSSGGQQMTCSFVQVIVDLVKTPSAAAAQLEKEVAALRAAPPEEFRKSCDDQRKSLSDLAATIAKAKDSAPRLQEFAAGLLQRLEAACSKPTAETLRDLIWYPLEKDTKTCRIWANPWKETFIKRIGGKWVSNRGPGGVCGVVHISTLESRPVSKELDSPLVRLWTYETQKVITNRAGPLCQHLDETKARYSWDVKNFDRRCEFIEFGP